MSMACEGTEEQPFPCEIKAMQIFLPENKSYPSPNLKIEGIQYYTESGFVDQKTDHDSLDALLEAVNKVAATSFAKSTASFDIMIRFTLKTNEDAYLELQTSDESEMAMKQINEFLIEGGKLTDFHSLEDVVYLVIKYKISPAS